MKRLCILKETFEKEVIGKSMTPTKLKNTVEEITKKILGNDAPSFNWYKCDEEDEYEFSGIFTLDDLDKMERYDIEIMIDYSRSEVMAKVCLGDHEHFDPVCDIEDVMQNLIKDLENAPTGSVKEDFTIGTLKEQVTDSFIKTIANHLVKEGWRKTNL